MPQELQEPSPLEKTRSRVRDEILKITQGKRRMLTIVESGAGDVAGYFSMGHNSVALVDDLAEAVNLAKRWPWLKIMTADRWNAPSDIFIEGEYVEVSRVPATA